MKFSTVLAKVTWLLLSERRVTYRRIKREFGLDSDTLEDVRHELIQIKRCAADEGGEFLVWAGTADSLASMPPSSDRSSMEPLEPVREIRAAVPLQAVAPGELPEQSAPLPTEGISATLTPASDAERRPLTVMFCDLADSTALSTKLDPEDLQDVIRAYQETCTKLIQEYEGFVAKYMGDGILVYFGYPHSLERDAERAVRSALAIVEAMVALNETLGRDKGIEIAVRIGVATGMVMVGELVGEGLAQERTVIGEAPNIAARLQSLAGRNGIVIGSLTKELTGDAFIYQDLGAKELKGISGLVKTWGVVGLHDDAADEANFDDDDGVTTIPELVGRDEETGLLRRAWQSVKDEGRGQVVTISGEAGIGKSVLIDGLGAEVRAEGLPRLTMRCSPYHANSALYPVIEYYKRLARWRPEDGVDQRLAKLEAALEAFSQPVGETVPLLAALLSLPLPEDRYPPLDLIPQQQKQWTQDAIIAMTLETAESQPLLQLWEDLHWADHSTLELLGLLIEQAPTASLLILLTARPEFVPPWQARSHITPITLNRLERPHAAALVGHIAGKKPLPDEVVDHIVAKTDGVPLYVEELTKTILASDILRDAGERFELTGPLSSLAIPDTLQESLMARLDRLPQVRELAQLGSVLGREFAYEMISGLSTTGDTILQEGLGQLVEAELLYQRGRPPRSRYIFKHALIQDAAYGSLLRRTRQQYHQQVADLLESRFPAIFETEPELLAHHLTEAGLTERAIGHWHAAGKRAADRSANTEAVGHLTRALELVESLAAEPRRDEMELDLSVDMINPIVAAKGYSSPELERTFRRALALCREIGTTPRIFPLLYAQWVYHVTTGQVGKSVAFGEEFLRLATEQQAEDLRLIGHRLFGVALFIAGNLRQAETNLERALALYDPDRHRALALSYGQDIRVAVLVLLANTTWSLGHPDHARELADRSLAEAPALNHANTEGYAMAFRLLVLALRRDLETLRQSTDALAEFAAEHRLPMWEAVAKMAIGHFHIRQGRHEQGLASFEQAQALYDTMKLQMYLPILLTWQAEALAALGRYDRALDSVEQAMAVAVDGGERWSEAETQRIKGEILGQSGDWRAAETCFLKAIEVAASQAAKSFELRAATSLARLWHQHGKSAEARECLASVYGWFTEGFETPDLTEAKALLDELA